MAAATVTPDLDPVTLVRDQAGFRLEATTGQLMFIGWLDAPHLLAHWSLVEAPDRDATYLVDLNVGMLRRLIANSGQPQVIIQPGGRRALVLWQDVIGRPGHPVSAGLFDGKTNTFEMVFGLGFRLDQWADAADRQWNFGETLRNIDATWIDTNTFALTVAPQDSERNLRDWGKVLLVNAAARSMHVLAEQGHLAAAMDRTMDN